jgi:DNA-binding CsgD family transcriptional regulator
MAIREVSKAKRGGSSAKAKPDGSSAEPSSIESQTTPGTDASGGAEDRSRTATAPERRRVHWRLADKPDAIQTRVLHEAAIATLDKFNRGILLLNPGGAVCFVNRAAEAMLARNDGLWIHRGRLQLEAADARADLADFLAAGGGAADRSSLVLRAGSACRSDPYRVLISPLVPHHGGHHGGTGHSVFIYEPSGGLRPVPVFVLRQLYALTAAEARLANELFAGRSLAQAALACCISINTAKSVLKRIFAKCLVGSQAELVLLLSLGPRTL